METPPSVDGVALPSEPASTPSTPVVPSTPAINRASVNGARRILLAIAFICYGAYAVWCLALMAALPSPTGGLTQFTQIGTMSAYIGAAGFVLFFLFGLVRIRSNGSLPADAKQRALIRIVLTVVPGILLSLAVPFVINREPSLTMEIIKPTQAEDFVSPVAVTFSVEKAVEILRQRGSKPLTYHWDVNGDGKSDQDTVVPVLTTTYQREGTYLTTVTMSFGPGSTEAPRTIARRILISQAVFTSDPANPIVNQPATLDASNLIKDLNSIDNIAWDFDNDGKVDAEGKETSVTTTFFRTGTFTVAVTIRLTNKTETQYKRALTVTDPEPLPFPVTVTTEPKKLLSPAPFVVVFTVDTKEPIANVQWVFGDGGKGEGPRAAHQFTQRGNFSVLAKIRSQSGSLAQVVTNVKIVDPLNISDLTFDGTPEIQGGEIQGEIPLALKLQPKTNAQFIDFSWESPGVTEDRTLDGDLDVTYRKPGKYVLTLIAVDAEQHVMRKTFSVNVLPVSSHILFQMQPEDGVAPLKVSFDASESDIPGETISGFVWDFGDQGSPLPTGASTEHVYTSPGTYTVSLTAQTTSGRQESTNRTIVVRAPALQAMFLASRLTIPQDATNRRIQFDSSSTKGAVKTFLWDFGGLGQSSEQNPNFEFTKPGVFPVVLTVTDDSGTKSTYSVTITVK